VSTIPHLTGDKLRAHRFPFPSRSEQEAIVEFLDSALADVTRTFGVAQTETSLLREYRTRLIADVVTGKLDVRDAAARLPDEPDEPEPAEEAEAPLDGEESQADDLDAIPEEAEA
jgi:type I restriction enzyme S subunit